VTRAIASQPPATTGRSRSETHRHQRDRGAASRRSWTVACKIHRQDGAREQVTLTCRIDTLHEVDDSPPGGVLHYVLRQLLAATEPVASAD
jgi:aconitase A